MFLKVIPKTSREYSKLSGLLGKAVKPEIQAKFVGKSGREEKSAEFVKPSCRVWLSSLVVEPELSRRIFEPSCQGCQHRISCLSE
jgi:hypothetical protein